VDGRRLGVEPICTLLQVASSTYYAARSRPPSPRAVRDTELIPRLVELWKDNYEVYGSRKLHKAARRAGIDIGRDQAARLMRRAGIQGARRSKRVRTTRREAGAGRHPDLVNRQFTAAEPNRLWVTDLTFVATWAGVAYACLIVDALSRMIVGWRVASHMRTQVVCDAIEMARWNRGLHHDGLRCQGDAGSQFTSIRYGERLAEIGAVASIGTVGDSFDNALAETVIGLYKTGLVRGPARPGPWRTVEDVELHARLGALAQHPAPARLPRRHPARRVRGGLLRCPRTRPRERQDSHLKTRARASIRPRTVQTWWQAVRWVRLTAINQAGGPSPSSRAVAGGLGCYLGGSYADAAGGVRGYPRQYPGQEQYDPTG